MPEPAKPPSLPSPALLATAPGSAGEHVSLRTALAMILAEDLEEGLATLDAAIGRASNSPSLRSKVRLKSLALQFSLPLALVGLVVAGAELFDGTLPGPAFTLLIALVAVPPLILAVWHAWQYGAGFPGKPLPLPHESDPKIDFVLGHLQKETGPAAWRRASFSGHLQRADRHLFYGRLRYLLMSEDLAVRRQVSGFPLPFTSAGDLFLARADAEHLRSLARPKRRGGPGREPKYAYVKAVVATLMDPAVKACDPGDRDGALRFIENRMVNWFEVHADASGDMPRKDQIRPYAIEILEGLVQTGTTH